MQIFVGKLNTALGAVFIMCTVVVALSGQGPLVTNFTVYEPIVLDATVIAPVVEFNISPAGELVNTPPAPVANIGITGV